MSDWKPNAARDRKLYEEARRRAVEYYNSLPDTTTVIDAIEKPGGALGDLALRNLTLRKALGIPVASSELVFVYGDQWAERIEVTVYDNVRAMEITARLRGELSLDVFGDWEITTVPARRGGTIVAIALPE